MWLRVGLIETTFKQKKKRNRLKCMTRMKMIEAIKIKALLVPYDLTINANAE